MSEKPFPIDELGQPDWLRSMSWDIWVGDPPHLVDTLHDLRQIIGPGRDSVEKFMRLDAAQAMPERLKVDVEKYLSSQEGRLRVDGLGRAYAGSQLQIQIYVNRRKADLSRKILAALSLPPSAGVRWVSPIETGGFKEYHDAAFLQALELDSHWGELNAFWPTGGPHWDALAIVQTADAAWHNGVVLVEAKSHPSEVYGGGLKAGEESRLKIKAALRRTKHWLGVPENLDWTGPLYQSANRLAHLYFFREVLSLPCWLINVYFVDDPHSPTSLKQWESEIADVQSKLGLAGISVPYFASIFLEAGCREDLTGVSG